MRADGRMTAVTRVDPKVRHGRRETRQLWALADPERNACAGDAGEHETAWPHRGQVCRVRRHRVDVQTGEITEEIRYFITSLSPSQANARRLLQVVRGQWGSENRLHWIRDVPFDEDRCPIRTGAPPQVAAACRHLAIALVRRAGQANVAAALRTCAGRPTAAIARLATAGTKVMK